MKTLPSAAKLVLLISMLCLPSIPANSQTRQYPAPISGQGIEFALFELNEMDMHLHAGMERRVPLDEWIDLCVQDGRKVLVLLDHIELYRKNQQEHKDWIEQKNITDWYPLGLEGQKAFMEDMQRARERKDVITFRGWEIWEGELDQDLDVEPMELAEVIGWHISPNNGGPAPNGQALIRRAKQIIEVQKQFPVPMILYHPFSMRLENLLRTGQNTGRSAESFTVKECRFFQPGEQEQLIRILNGRSIYIEISRDIKKYWDQPNLRQAVIEDIRPLTEAGVQFVVSTDAHGVHSLKEPFRPDVYCGPLGITKHHTNAIVRELLAIRAKANTHAK